MEKRVYKFQDHRDYDSAYIVALSEEQAIELMKQETKLEFTLCGSEPVDDLPRANLNRTLPYFYKNNIELF